MAYIRSLLPRGVYRSIADLQKDKLAIRGQVFTGSETDLKDTKSVTDDSKAIFHLIAPKKTGLDHNYVDWLPFSKHIELH